MRRKHAVLADAPMVWLGERMTLLVTRQVPMRVVHGVQVVLFAVLGVFALLG